MQDTETYELSRYLPPYRSLLDPEKRFDYRSHEYVDPSVDLRVCELVGRNKKGTPGPEESIKMKYRSLLTPLASTGRRIIDAASDTLSIKSFKSSRSNASLRRSFLSQSTQSLTDLPDEILLLIFSFLHNWNDQRSLVHLLYVSRRCNQMVKPVLYADPYVTSTYRLGQLVHTLNNNKQLALLVRKLDLSRLRPGVDMDDSTSQFYESLLADSDENDVPGLGANDVLAGWRDWRYRDHPLYGLQRSNTVRYSVAINTSTHTTTSSHWRSSSVSSSLSSAAGSLFSMSNESQESELTRSLSLSPSRSRSSRARSASFGSKSALISSLKKVFKSECEHKRPQPQAEIRALFEDYLIRLTDQSSLHSHAPTLTSPPRSRSLKPAAPYSTPHPFQNRFLSKYCFSKDVPIGYVLHLLEECENLVHVNLSGVSCSVDFEMGDYEYFDWETSKGHLRPRRASRSGSNISYGSLLLDKETGESQKAYKEKLAHYKCVRPIYWSDTLREINWDSGDCRKLDFGLIWEKIMDLKKLERLDLCSLVWLNKSTISMLLSNGKSKDSLQYIDCTDSGMRKSLPWAKKRTVKEWNKYLRLERRGAAIVPPMEGSDASAIARQRRLEEIGREYY